MSKAPAQTTSRPAVVRAFRMPQAGTTKGGAMGSSGKIVTPGSIGAVALSASTAPLLSGIAARLMNGDALQLGIVSSSSFWGQGLGATEGAGYQCWTQLMAKYGNTASTIRNLGMGGAKVAHIADGISRYTTDGIEVNSAEGSVRAYNLDALIVNINFNDNNVISAATYGSTLLRALLTARRAGAVVILVPPLHYGPYWTSWGGDYSRAAYAAGAKAGAAIIPIEATNALPGDTAIDQQWYQSDNTHPNVAGALRYGAAFASYWPSGKSELVASCSPRTGAGTSSDPVIDAPYFSWRNANGRPLRTIHNRTDTGAGRDVALYPTVPHTLFSRGTIWATDCTVSGQTIVDASSEMAATACLGLSTDVEASADPVVVAGGGLEFNGSTARVGRIFAPSGSRARVLFGASDATVRVITSDNAVSADNGIMIGRSIGSGNISIYRKSDGPLVVVVGGTSTDFSTVNAVSGPLAITVTASAGASKASVYVNGVLAGTAAIGGIREENIDWTIGARWTDVGMTAVMRLLNGRIHWASIANAYTSAIEETAWYANAKTWIAGRGVTLP